MPKRHRRRCPDPWQKVVLGIDGARRYAWWRAYSAEDRERQLHILLDAYRDRIDVLVPELFHLVDSVLHERNLEAFAQAYRVQTLIEQFEATHHQHRHTA